MLTTDGQDEHGWGKDFEQVETKGKVNHGWSRSVNPIQNTHKIAKSIVKPR
jgi:hypothetical protein